MKTSLRNTSLTIFLLLILTLLVSLAAPDRAHAFSCYGKVWPAACGGHGTCVAQDACSCDTGWAGPECTLPHFCGSLDCQACSMPIGACNALGPLGTCYCATGSTGACCESINTSGMLAPAGLDFGAVNVGAAGFAQTVTFTNPSQKLIKLTNIALSGANPGDFALGGTCANGALITNGATCTISVSLTPSATGPRSAALTVTYDNLFETQSNVPPGTYVKSNAVSGAVMTGLQWVLSTDADCPDIWVNGVLIASGCQNGAAVTAADTVQLGMTSSASSNGNVTGIVSLVVQYQNFYAPPYLLFTVGTGTLPAASVTTSLNGSGVIAASSVVIDAANPGTLYAGLDGAGIFKSTDNGATWNPAATQPANKRIKVVVITKTDSTKLFAAAYGGGVFKSTDSGANWSACANTNLTNLNLVSLTIDAGGKLYAGTEAGVFVSTDGCATWTAMNNGLPN